MLLLLYFSKSTTALRQSEVILIIMCHGDTLLIPVRSLASTLQPLSLLSQHNPTPTQHQLNLTRLRLGTIITPNPPTPPTPPHHKLSKLAVVTVVTA